MTQGVKMKSGYIQGFCDYCKVEGEYNEVKKYRWYEDTLYGFCPRACAVKFANQETAYRKQISEWVNAE